MSILGKTRRLLGRAKRKAQALGLDPLRGVKHQQLIANNLHKTHLASLAVAHCVENREHKDILFAALQLGLDVVVDSREICAQHIKQYLPLIQPADITGLVRIGGCRDGGYAMLPPPPILDSQPKAISLGVSYHSPWDLEMANMGYQVLQYDASIKHAPYNHPNIIFHKKFAGIHQDHQTITLEQILQDYRFDPQAHNILQIDIEGAEWEIFEQIDFSLLERYFAQIIVEFHNCDPRSIVKTKRYTEILSRFRKAYQPIHLHFNPCWGVFYVKDQFFAPLLEVSYARKDLLPPHLTLRESCGDIAQLDYPNNDMLPNFPIRF